MAKNAKTPVKSTKQLQQERDKRPPRVIIVTTVMDRMARGLVGSELMDWVKATYFVGSRTARMYISDAKVKLAEVGSDFAQSQIAEMLFKLRGLYEMAKEEGDIDTCLEILRHQGALTGLNLKDGEKNITILANQFALGGDGASMGDENLRLAGNEVVTTIKALVGGDKKTRLAVLQQIQRTAPIPVGAGNGKTKPVEPILDAEFNDDDEDKAEGD